MVTSLGLVTLGLFCAVWSFLGWARTERALRRHEALPGASGLVVAWVGLVVCATIVVAGVLVTWLVLAAASVVYVLALRFGDAR